MWKKLYRKFATVSSVLVAVLLVILAFGKIDYNISLYLLNPKSIWANFFNIFGEQPAFWGLLIGTAILFFSNEKGIKALRSFSLVFGFLTSFLFVYLIIITPVRYIYEEIPENRIADNVKATVVVLSLVISILITAIAPKYKDKLKKYRIHAIFLILTILTEMLLVNIMKGIWGRPRMRSISGFEDFRYWYEIACPAAGQEYRSFPSGHTANAFTMMAYCVLIPEAKKIKGRLLFVIAVLWGSLVAISRVVLGAHFLSDVIAGFYVTLICTYCYYRLLFRK